MAASCVALHNDDMDNRNKVGLHQRYMSSFEFRKMLADYESLCGKVITRKETDEERIERLNRKPYKYDLCKAAERVLNRNKE